MRWRTLLLLTLMAMLSMGGTFSCSWNSDGDDDDPAPPSTRAAVR